MNNQTRLDSITVFNKLFKYLYYLYCPVEKYKIV